MSSDPRLKATQLSSLVGVRVHVPDMARGTVVEHDLAAVGTEDQVGGGCVQRLGLGTGGLPHAVTTAPSLPDQAP